MEGWFASAHGFRSGDSCRRPSPVGPTHTGRRFTYLNQRSTVRQTKIFPYLAVPTQTPLISKACHIAENAIRPSWTASRIRSSFFAPFADRVSPAGADRPLRCALSVRGCHRRARPRRWSDKEEFGWGPKTAERRTAATKVGVGRKIKGPQCLVDDPAQARRRGAPTTAWAQTRGMDPKITLAHRTSAHKRGLHRRGRDP